MSALMPPKHDLSGGNASADSFATSKTTFVTLTSRCLFAADNQPSFNSCNSLEPYIGLPHFPLRLLINAASEENPAWLPRRRRCTEQSQESRLFSRGTRVHHEAAPGAGSPWARRKRSPEWSRNHQHRRPQCNLSPSTQPLRTENRSQHRPGSGKLFAAEVPRDGCPG